MLLSRVFQIGGGLHQLARPLIMSFGVCQPGRGGLVLDPDLSRPVIALPHARELLLKCSQLFYVRARHLPAITAGTFGALHQFLFRKWMFDELYDRIAVRPAFFLGRRFWKIGDGLIIDGCGPDGVASSVRRAAAGAGRLQTGFIYNYAFSMLIGLAALVTLFMFFALRGG